jgi:hypothetical protein
MAKRYQRGNKNLYKEVEQTTQWQKDKVLKGQTKIYKTYIYNPTKTGGEIRCSGRIAVPAPFVTPIVLI